MKPNEALQLKAYSNMSKTTENSWKQLKTTDIRNSKANKAKPVQICLKCLKKPKQPKARANEGEDGSFHCKFLNSAERQVLLLKTLKISFKSQKSSKLDVRKSSISSSQLQSGLSSTDENLLNPFSELSPLIRSNLTCRSFESILLTETQLFNYIISELLPPSYNIKFIMSKTFSPLFGVIRKLFLIINLFRYEK